MVWEDPIVAETRALRQELMDEVGTISTNSLSSSENVSLSILERLVTRPPRGPHDGGLSRRERTSRLTNRFPSTMPAGRFRIAAAFLLLSASLIAAGSDRPRHSSQLPERERVMIEALITKLETLTGTQFVRNGKAYSPATAGKFLRGKWKDRVDEVRSADDFIEKVATRSSTTGRPYLVRYSDKREITTAEFLRAQLERMRAAPRSG
jgi:hypothetical protein